MLTDSERQELVEELIDALMPSAYVGVAGEREDIREKLQPYATKCLPIIERLLAERDLDALLDSVHPGFITVEHIHIAPNEYRAYLYRSINSAVAHEGTGPTRTAAVRNAVAAARDQTP